VHGLRPSFPVALLSLALLTGCIEGLLEGSASTTGLITRTVEVRLDAESMGELAASDSPAEAMEATTTTEFEYTHEGDPTDPDDVTVTYTDMDGDEVERALSDFTSRDSVSEGDRITITGASPYSGVSLDGGGIHAERDGDGGDWLRVGGYPLPLAIGRGSSATWDADLSVAYGLTFDHFLYESREDHSFPVCEYDFDPETGEIEETDCTTVEESSYDLLRVDDAGFAAEYGLAGEMTVSATGEGDETTLDLRFEGEATVSADAGADAAYESTWTSGDEAETDAWAGEAGFDGGLTATGESLARFIFEDGVLSRAGGSASYGTGGHFRLWGDNHTQEDPYEPLREEDWPEGEVPYEEESAFVDPDEADADDVALMERIWAMDLVPGDRFEFLIDIDEAGTSLRLSLAVAVGALEEVTVEAGTFEALRMESTVEFDLDADGVSPQHMEFDGMRHWVHSDTYLPLRISTQTEESLPADEIEAMLRELATFLEGENTTLELPAEIDITTTFAGALELTDLEGEVRMPGLLSGLGVWAPVAVAAFGAVGFLGGGYLGGGYDDYDEYDDYGEYDDYSGEVPPPPAFPSVVAEDHEDPLGEGAQDNIVRLTHVTGPTIYPYEYTWFVDGQTADLVACSSGDPVEEWSAGDDLCLREWFWQAEPGEVALEVMYWDGTIVYEETIDVA
jgi:hypothetical protein